MMRAPDFWSAPEPGWQAMILAPFGWLYGQATLARNRKPGLRCSLPVISIGNLTAGGAGKTPTALAIADMLVRRGERPAIITRGYGGSVKGPLRVDPSRHRYTETGDEALMMARSVPSAAMIIVARDRAAGARLATEAGATCLVLDDALQNPTLVKDLSIAVIDGGAGFGNGCVIPAGPLRGPVAGQIAGITDVLLVGPDVRRVSALLPQGLAWHQTGAIPDAASMDSVRGRKVLAYCGIGRPEKFADSLRAAGAEIIARRDFADHHAYTPEEAREILAGARQLGALPVTTAKDHVRLSGDPDLAALAEATAVFSIRYRLPEALESRIIATIEARRRDAT